MSKFCGKHGGNVDLGDAYWACDICARKDIDPCSCGSTARYFGEALMCSISCENPNCSESLMGVGEDLNIRERWNRGERGYIKESI